jgi:F0F1-type ATP synthase assembly protein I
VTTEPRDSQGGAPRPPAGGLGADASRGMNQASRGLAVAFGFVGVVLVFFGAGRLLDKWLGTEPWLQVVGSIAGWVLGVIVVYYMSQRSLD